MGFFDGKVALVTGASSGIGRETALELAKQGATVGLLARRRGELEALASLMNGRGVVLPADVTRETEVHAAAAELARTGGKIDILVAAAGISLRASFMETRSEAARSIMEVNFLGVLHATQAVLPHIIATKGSVVAVSSLAGRKGTPQYSVYGASKFAVQGLYDSLRVEMRPKKVHVGVLAPGFVDTPLREKVLDGEGKVYPTPPELPFRLWPVQLCVQRLLKMIRWRQREALIPGFVHYLLTADHLVFRGLLSDRVLARRFGLNKPEPPPDGSP